MLGFVPSTSDSNRLRFNGTNRLELNSGTVRNTLRSNCTALLEKSIGNLYFQAHTLALTMARRAELYEFFDLKATGMRRVVVYAADHLYLDLNRLETAS